MTNRSISIFNQLRPYSVGFDDVFDHFGRMFDDSLFDVSTVSKEAPDKVFTLNVVEEFVFSGFTFKWFLDKDIEVFLPSPSWTFLEVLSIPVLPDWFIPNKFL